MLAVVALLTMANSTATTGSSNPGATIAVTQSAMDYLNYGVFTPRIRKFINHIKIKKFETTIKGIKVKVEDIHTYDFNCKKCFQFKVLPGQLKVISTSFTLRIGAKFSYKWKFVRDHGKCGLKIKTGSIGYILNLGHKDGHPTVKADDVQATFHDLDVGCSGVTGALINGISLLFKGRILDALKNIVAGQLKDIAKRANDGLANIAMTLPIDDYAVMRYDLVQDPQLDKSIAVAILGKCVPKNQQDMEIPYPLPKLPLYDSSVKSYVQLALTDYSINSIAYTYFKGGFQKGVVKASDIPEGFPIQLNTHNLAIKLVAPQIEKTYPNMTMQLSYSVKDKPWVNITTEGVRVIAPFTLDFQVCDGNDVKEAFTFFCPLTVAATITISKQKRIAANLTLLSCHLTLEQSKVGDISDKLLAALVDFSLVNIVLPVANKVLNVGIPIPGTDEFHLNSTSLHFNTGYFMLASKFKIRKKSLDQFVDEDSMLEASEKDKNEASVVVRRRN